MATAAAHARKASLARRLGLAVAVLTLLAGCANPVLRQADDLALSQRPLEALQLVDTALADAPQDLALRGAQQRLREKSAGQLVQQIDALRAAARHDEALALIDRLQGLQPQHPRLRSLRTDVERSRRHDTLLQDARQALTAGQLTLAEERLREVALEQPSHPALRPLQMRLSELQIRDTEIPTLGAAFQKPIQLEFREAPLRSVFESLSRSSGVSFVFDREVRSDLRITAYLRNTTLDEAMRIILGSNQLDRKILNAETVLIFPATQAKQREHQELISRTLYLANADVRQAQNLVRTIAKVRDVFVDERLNLMVIRDTPEVVRLVERLVASIDLPEPEVMLDVEVLEVASDRLDALGLQWPTELQFGLPGATGQVELGERSRFRGTIANPAVVATLRGNSGMANLLANPKIRVRNKEKAKVHIGQKLPIFTTTSTVNVGVSSSVTYLDVGLKLDVEPAVGLDNEVSIRMGLEVSNLLAPVNGPAGSIAYNVGTRVTTTTLRLADGETQIISGLISDEDRRTAAGVPGLSTMPVLGALFGLNSTTRNKTEVVLLITPRVVRGMVLPDAALTRMPAGNDASPGAFSTQLRPAAPKP